MWRKLCLVTIVLFSIGLSGCTEDKEIVVPHKMTNEIRVTMNRITDEGIYAINYPKEKFILFHGIEKGIKTMSYAVKDKTLTIHLETEDQKQPGTAVYQYKLNPDYDRIQVTVDGNVEAFTTVFVEP